MFVRILCMGFNLICITMVGILYMLYSHAVRDTAPSAWIRFSFSSLQPMYGYTITIYYYYIVIVFGTTDTAVIITGVKIIFFGALPDTVERHFESDSLTYTCVF